MRFSMKKIVTLLILSTLINAVGFYYLNSIKEDVIKVAYKVDSIKPYSDKLLESEEIYDLIDSFINSFNNKDFNSIKQLWLNGDIDINITEDFIVFIDKVNNDEVDCVQSLRKTAFNDYQFYMFSIMQSSAILSYNIKGQYGTGHVYFHLELDLNGKWKIKEITGDI